MDWSPFYCLPRASLTPAGLIELDTADHETLLLRKPGVEFRHEGPTPMAPRPRNLSGSERWRNRTNAALVLAITTHRFVLLLDTKGENSNASSSIDARFVHLSNVKKVTPTGGPSLMSPNATYKLVLETQSYESLILVFSRRDDRDQALRELKLSLDRKRWEVATRLAEQTKQTNAKLSNKVGLDRIMAKQKLRHEQNAKLTETALSGDSENLLKEAAGLLKVIQKYTVLVQKLEDSDDNDSNTTKLKGLLSDMGMTAALSQSKVGRGSKGGGFLSRGGGSSSSDARLRDYHELTARQVADFLVPRLKKQSQGRGRNRASGDASGAGIMSLTDVYCLFNRARGSNLVSPEDLRASCELLDQLGVGLTLRTFPSGIVCVQLNDLAVTSTNYAARRRFLDLCNTSTGQTALEASHALGLSPLLAAEQLEEAERLGWLCRDVSDVSNTVRWFPNKFMTAF